MCMLNAFGVQGKNNLRDRSVILATSYLIMSGTVFGLKSWTKIERPDGTSSCYRNWSFQNVQ